MAEPERLDALKKCLAEYRAARRGVNDRLPEASGAELDALAGQAKTLAKKIEQTEIEIRCIEDINGLIQQYTGLQAAALESAGAESDPVRKKAFEDRATLCETVVNEALEKKQEVKSIPPDSLRKILADLHQAAQEAKNTVASTNRAIEITNKVLDVLIMLAKAAAKFAV
jgi:hypothetical protein